MRKDKGFEVLDRINLYVANNEELEKVVKKGADNKLFAGCEVFDVYEGEHVQEGFKSVAFRIKLQDSNATMTDETIEAQMANVRLALKKAIPDAAFRE